MTITVLIRLPDTRHTQGMPLRVNTGKNDAKCTISFPNGDIRVYSFYSKEGYAKIGGALLLWKVEKYE